MRACFGSLGSRSVSRRLVIVFAALIWSTPCFSGEIHDAAQGGDLAKARALLAADPSLVYSKDDRGWTPLYLAAAEGRKEMVALLLANRADVNLASSQGLTPLHVAVLNHHGEVADLLLASNAEVNIQDAAAGGYLERVKTMVKKNPELVFSKDQSGWTALHFAARNDHKDVVEFLVANKADVNAKTGIGMTPLQCAVAFGGYKDVVEVLLAHKADVNIKNHQGATALHYAASHGYLEVVKLLLANKSEINATDNMGRTPLHNAADNVHMDVVELLLTAKADVNVRDNAGQSALDLMGKNNLY